MVVGNHLENVPRDVQLKGLLMVTGERPAETVCQLVVHSQEVRSLKVE